ncbi:hypothetical protein BX600DRAFT_508851 [Xylariales sp. PMI_506]|nr:hypothetical protein BX600DRAFT_508851 [Xylariales sp. PMI_506]
MSSKRKFADFSTEPSRRGDSETRGVDSSSKRLKHKTVKKTQEKPNNTNWMKKRVRNIERTFKSSKSLPANTRVDLERELAHHKQKIIEAEDDKKLKKMISKYHMVRFFERQKAERLAKQLEKRIAQCGDDEEVEQLNKDLHVARIDAIYAKFFPYREPYVSLYSGPSLERQKEDSTATPASSAAKALRSERPELWGTIEKAADEGIPALVALRDRNLAASESQIRQPVDASSKHSSTIRRNSSKSTKTTGADRVESKGSQPRFVGKEPELIDGDSDSDGGFFE